MQFYALYKNSLVYNREIGDSQWNRNHQSQSERLFVKKNS